MNTRLIFNHLGMLLMVLSSVLFVVGAGAAVLGWVGWGATKGHAVMSLLSSAIVGGAAGAALWWPTRFTSQSLGRREALLLVTLSWLIGGVLAGLPYFLWGALDPLVGPDHPFHSPAACYFEAVSGLTTCGATVLTVIEDVPGSLLFWRALTQWLGGLGIVVLFVAVLPSLGVGGKKMMAAEATGITSEGLRPHIRETARVLWMIYLVFTAAHLLLLWVVGGMSLFDAACHAFTTISTGGFSTRSASYAAFDSSLINWISILFMLAGGVSFALYYQALRGRVGMAIGNTEFRLYLGLLLGGAVVAALVITGHPITLVSGDTVAGTTGASIEHALFTVVSLMTTSGFCTAEYDLWPPALGGLIFFLVFIGGCAGSTSGGIKVSRFWVALKLIDNELEREFRPSIVRPIRLGGTRLDPELRLNVISMIAAFLLATALCAVALMVLESGKNIDMASAVSGALACMSNTGPGLGKFGGAENYGWISAPSKIILALAMIVGRLEVVTCLVLLMPRFWRGG